MSLNILPEFAAFARRQVEAGAFASEQEALDAALKGCLAEHDALRASLQEAAEELERGEGIDGGAFMAALLAETEARGARIG